MFPNMRTNTARTTLYWPGSALVRLSSEFHPDVQNGSAFPEALTRLTLKQPVLEDKISGYRVRSARV